VEKQRKEKFTKLLRVAVAHTSCSSESIGVSEFLREQRERERERERERPD
jgi:hypothetical protein